MYLPKVLSKKLGRKKIFFVGDLEVTDEKSRIWIRIVSVSQKNGSADPDPYQKVTDPELAETAPDRYLHED
jgi:hypothetical protein